MSGKKARTFLKYDGPDFFRQRIVLSTLSGKPIKISNIRSDAEEPGVTDYEVKFLKIIDEITNGTKIEISETGTEVIYIPGLLAGGDIDQECDSDRCLSYYLEPLMYLSPFSKRPVKAKLRGVTNNQTELSVDQLKSSWLPVMRKFILNDDDLELKITKRGLPPDGGGEVIFTSPICRQLRPIQTMKPGKVKKIRGLAFACKVSPLMGTRMIESAKAVLKPLIGNVFITADHRKGPAGGNSPGFGLHLSAETTEGAVYTGDYISNASGSAEPSVPEDVGERAAHHLLEEIYRASNVSDWNGGCIDSSSQGLSCLFMVLGEKNVSKLVSGPLSNYSVFMLRHIKEFFDVTFKLENYVPIVKLPVSEDGEEDSDGMGSPDKVILTCVGAGFTNLNKMLL